MVNMSRTTGRNTAPAGDKSTYSYYEDDSKFLNQT